MATDVLELDALCRQRWPRIAAHCADPDPLRRALFCLAHAGLCSPAEANGVVADPDRTGALHARLRSYPADRALLAPSMSLFGAVASPEAFRTALTGPQLAFPFDVVVPDGGRVSVSDADLRALNDDLLRRRARLSTATIPDRASMVNDVAGLRDALRQATSSFEPAFGPLLQSNAPALRLRVSPIGEQLGATACGLSPHLATFARLADAVRAVRRSLDELARVDRDGDDADVVIREQEIGRLRRQTHALQTAIEHGERA